MENSRTLVVKSLRELDAAIAEYIFGWRWALSLKRTLFIVPPYSANVICEDLLVCRPECLWKDVDEIWDRVYSLPFYCGESWNGMRDIIQNREEAGYWVSMDGASGVGLNPDLPDAAFHKIGDTAEKGYAAAQTLPIAVAIAALKTVNIEVQLELTERE